MTQTLNGIQMFPDTNTWNAPIASLPVHPSSPVYLASIGGSVAFLDPHFDNATGGLPYNVVNNATPTYTITFSHQPSDNRPYHIPASPLIENGVDLHYLALNTDTGLLYEVFDLTGGPAVWNAFCGTVWKMSSNLLHPLDALAAEAAGLPILPGVINYPEASSGTINHALRGIIVNSSDQFVWPARFSSGHQPGSFPPAGARLRLKASTDISSFSTINKAILQALKTYGLLISDSSAIQTLRLSGTPDARWNTTDLAQLNTINASNFDVVDASGIIMNSNSAQVIAPNPRFSFLQL